MAKLCDENLGSTISMTLFYYATTGGLPIIELLLIMTFYLIMYDCIII